jgi:hypothetical protein
MFINLRRGGLYARPLEPRDGEKSSHSGVFEKVPLLWKASLNHGGSRKCGPTTFRFSAPSPPGFRKEPARQWLICRVQRPSVIPAKLFPGLNGERKSGISGVFRTPVRVGRWLDTLQGRRAMRPDQRFLARAKAAFPVRATSTMPI